MSPSACKSRLLDEELFRIGPRGLEEISDRTLDMRIDAAEIAALRRSSPSYQLAVADEMLQTPEAIE